MTISAWLAEAARSLVNSPDPMADSVWIMEETLSVPRSRLKFMASDEISETDLARLESALSRRKASEPVQYIFSRAPFMGYEFYVDNRVLIPRMDTEILCDEVRQHLRSRSGMTVLDMCAGSGAIGISLARMFPGASVTLSDISEGACTVQRINAEGLSNVEILTGDMFETVSGRRFDIITCNPPYIKSSVMETLQDEVKKEPALALDGGADGLDFYRLLAREYKKFLNPGGRIYMEIGYDQGAEVGSMFENSRLIRDLNGLDRVIWTEV